MIFDVEGIVFVALFLFWIWALLDCIATDSSMCRNLPKPMWIILVLILPDIGALIWLLLGRPERSSWRPGSTDYSAPRRPVGVEDSPRYTGPSRSPTADQKSSTASSSGGSKSARQPKRRSAPVDTHRCERPSSSSGRRSSTSARPTCSAASSSCARSELDRVELEQRARELDD